MSFADHFSTIAARYAAYRPTYPAALVDALVERATPGTAWDVGCGNGQLAVALADHFARVIATDPSRAQLAAALPHPRVEYRCAPAEASGLPDASADLIVAAQAAHWFDWPRFVGEAARVGKPGALVALVSYGILILDGEAGRITRDFYRDVVGPYWPPERAHVENGYRDLALPWPAVDAPPSARPGFAGPGSDADASRRSIDMTATWSRDELVGYISTWSATVKLVDARGPAPFEAFCAELAAEWPDDERRVVRWPLALRFSRR